MTTASLLDTPVRGWILLRETQRVSAPQREYFSTRKTWVKDLDRAFFYEDHAHAWEILRRLKLNRKNFFVDEKGYDLVTSFKRAEAVKIGNEITITEPCRTIVTERGVGGRVPVAESHRRFLYTPERIRYE